MDFLTNPFTTALLFLYQYIGQNIVLTIVIFTILIRLVTYPLNMAQMKSSKAMQVLQPRIKKLQDKYKGDREKLAQEQMKLYKEYGVNPMAGCLPLLIQLPILFSLYPAIGHLLAATPLQMVALYHSLMAPSLSHIIPLQNEFLWLNMAQPDPYYILPALVVATTWFQQKLMTPATPPDSKDASSAMSRNMMITMPLLFGLMSLQFAAGLSIYFIVSNLAGILQYALYNRTGSISAVPARVEPEEVEEPVAVPKKSLPAPSGNKASNKLAARRSAVEAHRKKKPGGPARGVTRSPATGSTATGRTKAGKAR
jgi:YidC/Oxa1 family membrane protein insertase